MKRVHVVYAILISALSISLVVVLGTLKNDREHFSQIQGECVQALNHAEDLFDVATDSMEIMKNVVDDVANLNVQSAEDRANSLNALAEDNKGVRPAYDRSSDVCRTPVE